ncbi:MAG: hypothetical protein K2F83_03560 [Oscillospiraceae bacterium]|nr:hypothetical protein [Oscillospiraceae bacterium]
MQGRLRGNEYRTTVVCIDSYEGCVPKGRFYNPAREGGTAFESLSQLVVEMEDLLDEYQLPQSFAAIRQFSNGSARPGSTVEDLEQRGKKATFSVRIIFRQNASWQGSVSWLEGKKEENFRSVLELILLMDGALRES